MLEIGFSDCLLSLPADSEKSSGQKKIKMGNLVQFLDGGYITH